MSYDYHNAASETVTGLISPLYDLPGGNPNDTKLNTVSIFHQSILLWFLFVKNHFIRQMYVALFPTALSILFPSMVQLGVHNRPLQCRISLCDVNVDEQ
jgi:hypothetical protein